MTSAVTKTTGSAPPLDDVPGVRPKTPEEAFIYAILESPKDPAPVEIYADWLDDNKKLSRSDAYQQITRELVAKLGGRFIGKEELVRLGKVSADAEVPPIPEEFSVKQFCAGFLVEEHPLRVGRIGEHVILAYDPPVYDERTGQTGTGKWYCIESSIVPGSLGEDGQGLSGDAQDALLTQDGKKIEIKDLTLSSPEKSSPVQRVLNNAIVLHRDDGKPIKEGPFYDHYGRTADVERFPENQGGAVGCRVLLGYSYGVGVFVRDSCPSDVAGDFVGLLASWNQKS